MPSEPGGAGAEAFAARLPFPLDDFQREGIDALARGRSVLVAAPTGAGKTVVGEYAVWRALERGGKCFYTTPIKALSNQKHADLCAVYGERRVGLLTGDRSVRGEAPIVVMTTEVLRNMLYEASPTLEGLDAVVLDEVHYLADRARGAVWEEVIVQLAPEVQLACLSATVSNAEEFGAWLDWVRGAALADAEGRGAQPRGCEVVISERRPVPLDHHYAFNDRIEPVFKAGGKRTGRQPDAGRAAAARQARAGVPNPDIVMAERRARPAGRRSGRGRPVPSGSRMRPPRRTELAFMLAERQWLPAIVFVFSRQGCEDAVGHLVRGGVSLASAGEAEEITALATEHVAGLGQDDLAVLGFDRWLAALRRGVAAHHAGMVPAFKEVVERLFVRGLLKVCFATETLALGINMPARTVVIERLEKWDGQQHALLTPGQLTQLTGRAGRRGLDDRGRAVILHQRDVDFTTVASLVGRRVEPLRSRFAPSYNMAVNLLRRHDRPTAESLLARSFAQWQADASVAEDSERIARNRRALAGYAENLVSTHGDFAEYWSLRRALTRVERQGERARRGGGDEAIRARLAEARPGDVLAVDDDLVAVVGGRRTKSGVPLAEVVTTRRDLTRLGPRELSRPPRKVGAIDLPASGGPRQAAYRRAVARALDEVEPRRAAPEPEEAGPEDGQRLVDEAARLREELRRHPVHHDPALAEIEPWAHRHDELAAETEALEARVARRTGSLVTQFARILGVLG
ncbi:MAG: DEAD/DEAH box helicase, partial [Actinomycetota bacterium]